MATSGVGLACHSTHTAVFTAAYDVTRRETFESLDDIWMREVDMYSTVEDSVKMVVANKCDKVRSHCSELNAQLPRSVSGQLDLRQSNQMVAITCRAHRDK